MPNLSADPLSPVRGAPPGVRLEVEPCDSLTHAGGATTYRVLLDNRWIGWVGDGREWTGRRFGGRRWWACWREEDAAARWSTGLDFYRRHAALIALLAQVQKSGRSQP